MENKIKVKFENIISNKTNSTKYNPEKSKSIENKQIKPNTKTFNINSKSPDTKKIPKDKMGNVVQPFSHLYGGDNIQKDIQKSVKCMNDLVVDYTNLEK
jgi:hypothetical protein